MSKEGLEFIMIAGCNVAGKSTFIRSRLNELERFEILMIDVYKGRTKKLVRTAITQRKNILMKPFLMMNLLKNLQMKPRMQVIPRR